MSNGHRWSKFWWQDWQNDDALRACCFAAQGLWMRLLCIAHNAVPYGHLLINGKQPTDKQLSAITGGAEREIKKLLGELEAAGVFSRTGDGTIYCRRMVRDGERSEEGREEISKRWGESDGKSRTQRLAAARRKGKHTPDEWHRLLALFGYRCVKCGAEGDTFKDHVIPIYRGGGDGIDNLQPLCGRCNRGKGPDQTDYRSTARPGWRDAYEVETNGHDREHDRYEKTSRVTSKGPPRELPRSASREPSSLEAEADSEAEAEANQGRVLNLPLGVGPACAGARPAPSGVDIWAGEEASEDDDTPTHAEIMARRERARAELEGVERVPSLLDRVAKSVRSSATRAQGAQSQRSAQQQINAIQPQPRPAAYHLSPEQLAEARSRTRRLVPA